MRVADKLLWDRPPLRISRRHRSRGDVANCAVARRVDLEIAE